MGSANPPLRLAILECDTPMPNTKAKFKGYGGVFTDLFTRACAPDPVSSHLSISSYDVVANHPTASYPPSLDDLDAILISGSRHNSFDNDEWILRLVEFTRRALDVGKDGGRRIKIVGVCFGHQIVGRALGLPVGRSDGGWEIAVTNVDLSEDGRKFFGLERMRIHQMHRDAVGTNPPDGVSLASNEVCPVQGFLIPGRVVTVQGHPEFTEEIVAEILEVRHDGGVFPDELYQSGKSRVGNEHDGVAIAKAFLKFLKE